TSRISRIIHVSALESQQHRNKNIKSRHASLPSTTAARQSAIARIAFGAGFSARVYHADSNRSVLLNCRWQVYQFSMTALIRHPPDTPLYELCNRPLASD